MLEFHQSNNYNSAKNENTEKYNNFKDLINTFFEDIENNTVIEEAPHVASSSNIKIVPNLIYNKFSEELKVDFKIGSSQLYKLKNLTEFYDRMLNHETFRYGAKFYSY